MLTQGQRIGWRGALIFPSEYFATASGSATASISGVSGAATAGTVSASGTALALPGGAATVARSGEATANGSGLAEIGGAGASAQAGELGAFTPSIAIASIAGAAAFASAGGLAAGQAQPQPQQESYGGWHSFRSVRVSAAAGVQGASAASWAGSVIASASGAATMSGVVARSQPGHAEVSNVLHINGVSATASAATAQATGIHEISDDEILVLLMAA